MKKIIPIVLLLSSWAFAKVAYIPLFDAYDKNNIQENTILAIDLETGSLLTELYVGNGVGAVFINAGGDKLYASAENENKIVLIDTKLMEISHEWTNLAIKPQQIILNKAENKLYFTEYNNDNIYQIDLTTKQISIVLTLTGLQRFWYSDNLDYIVFKTYDELLNTYSIHTYNLNQMSLKYVRSSGDSYRIFIGNAGERYYYPSFSYSRLYSFNLNNFDENWYFYYNYIPGSLFFSDKFSNVYPLPNDKLLVVGWHGTYEVDVVTGAGIKLSNLTNLYNPYNKINDTTFLKSSSPQLPFCGVPPPGADCYNYLPMELTTQNHTTGQEAIIFQQNRAGTNARGRYIGNNIYDIIFKW